MSYNFQKEYIQHSFMKWTLTYFKLINHMTFDVSFCLFVYFVTIVFYYLHIAAADKYNSKQGYVSPPT